MMTNLSIINVLLYCVADIYIKLKSITSKLHNTSASITFIKKALFFDVIPKFAMVRLEIIRENSYDSPWFHLDTKGIETWFNGLSFLWESESTWISNRKTFDVLFDDPELKKELHRTIF